MYPRHERGAVAVVAEVVVEAEVLKELLKLEYQKNMFQIKESLSFH